MLTARQYEILGKEIFKRNPGFANEVIKDLNIFPAIEDLSILPQILIEFCKSQNITLEELRTKENLRKTAIVEKKIIFCAVAVLMFQPENLIDLKAKTRYGFRNLISKELNICSQHSLYLISKARFYFQNYKEFKASVLSNYSQMIEKNGFYDN